MTTTADVETRVGQTFLKWGLFHDPDDIRRDLLEKQRTGQLETAELKALDLLEKGADSLGRIDSAGEYEVIEALISIAASESDELYQHEVARSSTLPITDDPESLRFSMRAPGITEIARAAGYERGSNGRVVSRARARISRNLKALCSRLRLIPFPIRMKLSDGSVIVGTGVERARYLRSMVVAETGERVLRLHPLIIASCYHGRIFQEPPRIRWERALSRIGRGKGQEETWHVLAERYMRYRAFQNTRRDGTLAVDAPKASRDTLIRQLGLRETESTRGRPEADRRLREALDFAIHADSRGLEAYEELPGDLFALSLLPEIDPERTGKEGLQPTLNGQPPISKMWEVWLDELGGDGRQPRLTGQRREVLKELYREQLADEDDPLATFRKVLGAIQASDHHMSERRFQMPESTFRDPERRDRWVEQALSPKRRKRGNGPTYRRLRIEDAPGKRHWAYDL